MATRRDVDVVIGARTDDASFQRAQSKTKAMLGRIQRTATQPIIGGQGTALERSQRVLAQVGAAAAAIAAIDTAAKGLMAAFDFAEARSEAVKGNLAEGAEGMAAAWQSMQQLPLGLGSLLSLAERLHAGALGEKTLTEQMADNARVNAENERQQQESIRRLENIKRLQDQIFIAESKRELSEQTRELKRQNDEEGLAILQVEREFKARFRNLTMIRESIDALGDYGQKAEDVAAIEETRSLLIEDMNRAVGDINRKFKEQRQAEAQSAIEQFKDFFRGGTRQAEDEPDREIPFRASLPTGTSGLLLGGFAAAAQSGQAFRLEQAKRDEDRNKKLDEQTAALRQLILVTQQSEASPAFILGGG